MRSKQIGFIDDKYINLVILNLKRNQLTEIWPGYFMYDSLLIWLYSHGCRFYVLFKNINLTFRPNYLSYSSYKTLKTEYFSA